MNDLQKKEYPFMNKFVFFTAAFLFAVLSFTAQSPAADSLKLLLKGHLHDTTRCIIYGRLIASENNETVWKNYNRELMHICKKNLGKRSTANTEIPKYKKYYAAALNNIAMLNIRQGEAKEAFRNYKECLRVLTDLGDERGISTCFNNMARVFQEQGDLNQALEYYIKSLQIKETLGDSTGIAISLNNLGQIYLSQSDHAKALDYFHRSLKIMLALGNKKIIASSYNNIAQLYQKEKDLDRALEYYTKSLKLKEEIDDKGGIARAFNNIGTVYRMKGENANALNYFEKGLSMQQLIKDKQGMAFVLTNLGNIYSRMGNSAKAIELCEKSLAISKEIGFPENIRSASGELFRLYKLAGKYELSLKNYELHIKMRDSINNESTRKASIRSQLKYEYEKQAAADSVAHAKESEIKSAELSRQSAEIKAKKNQQYALFGGLFLVCLFGVFMYNRFKVTQKQKAVIEDQKEIVEEQKKIVEEKQHEILDSIKYARRIQMAQIPSEKRVLTMLTRLKM
jgi:tetratricopeptide (TPR) repeat protein